MKKLLTKFLIFIVASTATFIFVIVAGCSLYLLSQSNWAKSLQFSDAPVEAGAPRPKIIGILLEHAKNNHLQWGGVLPSAESQKNTLIKFATGKLHEELSGISPFEAPRDIHLGLHQLGGESCSSFLDLIRQGNFQAISPIKTYASIDDLKRDQRLEQCVDSQTDGTGLGAYTMNHPQNDAYLPSIFRMYVNVALYEGLSESDDDILLTSEAFCRDSSDLGLSGQVSYGLRACWMPVYMEANKSNCSARISGEAFVRNDVNDRAYKTAPDASHGYLAATQKPMLNGVVKINGQSFYYNLGSRSGYTRNSLAALQLTRLFAEQEPDFVPDCEFYTYLKPDEAKLHVPGPETEAGNGRLGVEDFIGTALSPRNYLSGVEDKVHAECQESDFEWVRLASCLNEREQFKAPFLSKWPEGSHIKIGFDWNWTPSLAATTIRGPFKSGIRDRIEFMRRHVVERLPLLSDLTGLQFSIVSEDENPSVNFTILPRYSYFVPTDNLFRTPLPGERLGMRALNDENHFIAAVKFTPKSRTEVDGFFVPGASGEIKHAVCHINPALPDEMTVALVDECLVRGLGLPGSLKHGQSSLLGSWNRIHAPVSNLTIFDRPVSKADSWSPAPPWEDSRLSYAYANSLEEDGVAQAYLSALYDERITPGMTPEEVREVLPKILRDLPQE